MCIEPATTDPDSHLTQTFDILDFIGTEYLTTITPDLLTHTKQSVAVYFVHDIPQ
jgi:hypothetical protein